MVASPGTCDGNGDGSVTYNLSTPSSSNENLQFWRQLALAGLIEGSYLGLTGTGSNDVSGGVNLPKSRFGGGVWWLNGAGTGFVAGDSWAYSGTYGNYMAIGGAVSGSWPYTPLLKPEEAWNIDTKLDDGKPATGKIIARYWNNACATSTSNTDYTGNYKLSDSSLQCLIYFTQAF